MVSNLVFYQLALIALGWLFFMLSWWWPLEPAVLQQLAGLLPRDPWHALAWQTCVGRPHCACDWLLGRGLGHPGDGAGVRGRSEHGAGVVSGSGRAAAGLFPLFPARPPPHAGA